MKIYIVAVWEKGDEKEQDRIIALEWAFNETVGREHAHAALNEYSVENYHIAYWCLKMDSESFIQEGDPLINLIVLARAIRIARSQIMIQKNVIADLSRIAPDPEEAQAINARTGVLGVWEKRHGGIDS